jgi:hypothetical protein
VAVLEALVPYYLPDFSAAIWKAIADAKDSNVDLSSPKTPISVDEWHEENYGNVDSKTPWQKPLTLILQQAAFRKAVADSKDSNVDPPTLILDHGSLAAGYDGDEYTLLGMAVKYAGLRGVSVQFMGGEILPYLQANVLHANFQYYLPDLFAQILKMVADGKLRVLGLGHFVCMGTDFQFFCIVCSIFSQEKKDLPTMVLIHQDSFASGYHDDEYTLLGMAVKYHGFRGLSLKIIGSNHETF